MEYGALDNGNYYIHIPKGELCGEHCFPEIISCLPKNIEPAFLEIFDSSEGTLVFARPRDGTPTSYEFADLEDVIAAVRRCPEDTISYLSHNSDRYLLIIYPWHNEPPPMSLSEFSTPVSAHPDITRHLNEHGNLLLGPEAVRDLKRFFC